jgi:hypothetical protein
MSSHWSSKLKIQKMDRRMSGHAYFKYRLEFPWSAFNQGTFGDEPYHERTKTFYEFCRHLTDAYGHGPSVDDASYYVRSFGFPTWAFRLVSSTHTYAIYVADDESRQELEKILSFNILKH